MMAHSSRAGICMLVLLATMLSSCVVAEKPNVVTEANIHIAAPATVPTQVISADGVDFAYRELGINNGGTPVILLNHLAAVLDNWDPRIVDGIAAKHHVVAFDNRGVGASTGKPAKTIEQMADDAIVFIKAKGFKQVDLLGFSMGGMIAQEIALKEPRLVRKMILAGTGPAGGPRVELRLVARNPYRPGPKATPLLHAHTERYRGRQGFPATP